MYKREHQAKNFHSPDFGTRCKGIGFPTSSQIFEFAFCLHFQCKLCKVICKPMQITLHGCV